MKHVHFDYVNKFSCLAGACPDTCCKDWQIILDADAIARYASLPADLRQAVRAASDYAVPVLRKDFVS